MVVIKRQMVASKAAVSAGINTREFIVIHETANTSRGAGAQSHANLQSRGNSRSASWPYQVDDMLAIQSFEDTQICWHAGSGTGNRRSIGIEICVNSDGNFRKAVENAAELTAHLMKKHNIPLSRVVQHNYWSGKDCPRFLRNGSRGVTWEQFLAMVKKAHAGVKVTQISASKPVASSKVWDVRFADKGERVTQMQRDLTAAGYPLVADGSFGKTTEAALRAFQKAQGLKVDGIYGPGAQDALAKALVARKPAAVATAWDERLGNVGKRVGAIQRDLKALGYYDGTIDDSYGYSTESAVKAFQRAQGLKDDGIYGPASQKAMEKALKAASKPAPKKADIYRVIIDGKQVGAYGENDNALREAHKAIEKGAKNIRIEKV